MTDLLAQGADWLGYCSYVSAGYTNYAFTMPLDYSFQVGGPLGVAPVAWSLGPSDGALTFQTSSEVLTSTASWGGYTVNPWPDDSGWGPEHNGTTHVTCAPTDIDAGPTSATNPTDQLQGLVFYFHDSA